MLFFYKNKTNQKLWAVDCLSLSEFYKHLKFRFESSLPLLPSISLAPNYFYTFFYRWSDDDRSLVKICWFCQHICMGNFVFCNKRKMLNEMFCRVWWHCYCRCCCCAAQWMNEYFKLCFKFPCAVLCSCYSLLFAFVMLSLEFTVTMRNCLIACAVSSLCVCVCVCCYFYSFCQP